VCVSLEAHMCNAFDVPRLMNGAETVAKQILGVQSFDFLHFFRKMAFGRVVTKHMLHCCPDTLRARQYPAVDLIEGFKLLRRVLFAGQNLPHVAIQPISKASLAGVCFKDFCSAK